MSDRVRLIGIKFHGFHGLTRLERKIGVRYKVDIDMTLDLNAAMVSDRIRDTIDYRRVHDLIVEIGRGESFHLIKTLAGRIAEAILERFPVEEVQIGVLKETPVLDGIVESVGVEITRRPTSPPRRRRRAR